MCQRIGLPLISTIGFGMRLVSSERRVPIPPARMRTFIVSYCVIGLWIWKIYNPTILGFTNMQ